MIVTKVEVGIMCVNCYLMSCEKTKEAYIVDPGFDPEKIIAIADKMGLKIKGIVLTHGHYDHIGGCEKLRDYYDVKIAIHKDDFDMTIDPEKNLSVMTNKHISFKSDVVLEEMDTIKFGEEEVVVIHTPGHTMGSICLLNGNDLMTGDTLFRGSIGRTDLGGTSVSGLCNQIKEKLFVLPNDTVVYPGHNSQTTIGFEKSNNSFFA